MEDKILTTTQLWSNYDPYAEPLRPSYLQLKDLDTHHYFEAYINGDSYSSKPVRIFIRGYLPKSSKFNANIIFAGDSTFGENHPSFEKVLTKKGYGVFSFDYIGYNKNSFEYTKYPEEIKFANLAYCGDHLTKATHGAENTCVFIWSKVLRRVINLVKQLRGDEAKIILAGYGDGADITWQVAAVDNRVNGLTTILNAGWKEFVKIPKWSDNLDLDFDDERKRWLTACSTQSYIKFVKCPCLILAASNCTRTSVDRLSDTIRLLAENKVDTTMNISPGQSGSISKQSHVLFYDWIDHISKSKKLPLMPVVKLTEKDDSILAQIALDKSNEIDKITLHYSYDELDSRLRSWSTQLISMQGLKGLIPIYELTKCVFAYVTVEYKDGFEVSSVPVFHHLDLNKEYNRRAVKRTRIIYQTTFGTSPWLVENTETYHEMIDPKIDIGPLGIAGITADSGDLSTYTIGEYKYKSENQNLLQFDASTEKDRVLTVCIIAGEVGHFERYFANVNIKEGKWIKCSLKLSDFKTKNLVPLKEWGNVKKLTFINVKDVLFNNIIWV